MVGSGTEVTREAFLEKCQLDEQPHLGEEEGRASQAEKFPLAQRKWVEAIDVIIN